MNERRRTSNWKELYLTVYRKQSSDFNDLRFGVNSVNGAEAILAGIGRNRKHITAADKLKVIRPIYI